MQINAIKNISFGKNEVKLWLDGDGTYFPEKKEDALDKPTKADKIQAHYNEFDEFIQNSPNKVDLNITTGRNRGGYQFFLQHLAQAGVSSPVPKKVVVKNGGDSFEIKTDSFDKFSKNGLPLRDIDKAKRQEIQDKTNWNSEVIRGFLHKILENENLSVLYCADSGSAYGAHAANNILKGRNENTVVMRQDGDLGFYLGFPPGEKGEQLYNKAKGQIEASLNSRDIKYSIFARLNDWENGHMPAIAITPKIDGKKLEKDYDVKEEVKRAIKEGDLVIVAGDGVNDKKMLDPATYDEILKETGSKDLPLMSIVVGNKPELQGLVSKHPENVIKVKDGYELQDGIQKAIDKYAKTHPDFEIMA